MMLKNAMLDVAIKVVYRAFLALLCNFLQESSKCYKGRPSAGLNVLYADTHKTAVLSRSGLCPYCSPGNPDYPPILVQLLPLKWKERYEVSQILQLVIQSSRAKDVMVAPDYWAFIDGSTHPYESSSKVPLRRVLLPSEVRGDS